MGKTNRTHTPAFKAQVALAAIKGDRTISQVAAHYELHVNLVAHWKKQLLEGAATVFSYFGYNFCWPVRALRVKDEHGRWQKRTPAMAAGLADHVWSLSEWVTYPARHVQRK